MSSNLPDFDVATPAAVPYRDYEKSDRKARRKVILSVVVGILLVGGCLGAVVWRNLTTHWAEVGECLTSTGLNGTNANGVKVVECGGKDAAYRVTGITTGSRPWNGIALHDPCEEFPESTAAIHIPPGINGGGKVVCVADVGAKQAAG
jgi:hypothetical protein